MTWLVRSLLLYAVLAPLAVAAVAFADPTGSAMTAAAEKAPIIALIILFSSSVLAGASALFWKIYQSQAEQSKAAIAALHEHVAVISEVKGLLEDMREERFDVRAAG